MKKILLSGCFYILFFSTRAQSPGYEAFDTRSLNQFWKIYEILVDNKEPGEAEWRNLFSSPCYAFLKKDNFYKKLYRLAFKPDLKDSLEMAIKKDDYTAKTLDHLRLAGNKRQSLQSFEKTLDHKRIKDALRYTGTLLPRGVLDKYQLPPVLVSVFEPGAYSYNEQIAIDILFASTVNASDLISHEAHHFYTGKITRLVKPPKTNPDYYFVHAVYQLQIEGIADLLDVKRFPATNFSEPINALYNNAFADSYAVFRSMDSLIRIAAADTERRSVSGKQLFDGLVMAGHPNGFFMVSVVEKEIGRKRLVKELDNPFNLIWRYQAIAKLKPSVHYVFSDETVFFLGSLEKKYVRGIK